jgi:hypothetical protein
MTLLRMFYRVPEESERDEDDKETTKRVAWHAKGRPGTLRLVTRKVERI